MAAAALPLALSPLGGGEGGGDTNNTPPSRLQKKKRKGELGVGGSQRPQPCTCAPGSLARAARRCKLSTFFVPSAPPLTQPRMHVPPSLFIQPPRSSAPPASCPPSPFPSSANASAAEPPSGPRLPTPPAGPGAAVSAPPDRCKRSANPANQLPLPLPPRGEWRRADRAGGGGPRGADLCPQPQLALCTSKWSGLQLPFGAHL